VFEEKVPRRICKLERNEVKQSWRYTRVYPKVSGLAAWSENSKWYSSPPLGAFVSLFCESA